MNAFVRDGSALAHALGVRRLISEDILAPSHERDGVQRELRLEPICCTDAEWRSTESERDRVARRAAAARGPPRCSAPPGGQSPAPLAPPRGERRRRELVVGSSGERPEWVWSFKFDPNSFSARQTMGDQKEQEGSARRSARGWPRARGRRDGVPSTRVLGTIDKLHQETRHQLSPRSPRAPTPSTRAPSTSCAARSSSWNRRSPSSRSSPRRSRTGSRRWTRRFSR